MYVSTSYCMVIKIVISCHLLVALMALMIKQENIHSLSSFFSLRGYLLDMMKRVRIPQQVKTA